MNIVDLKSREDISNDVKLSGVYSQLDELIIELKKKELPQSIIETINKDIEEVNSTLFTANKLKKLVKEKQTKIIRIVEKDLKIAPKNYYRNLWLAVGMSAFGVPIGVLFGLSMGNMGLLAIGLPIGMAIGVAVGTTMDAKASKEGRQLDLEIKY